MQINPYLLFNGDCEVASPVRRPSKYVPAEWRDKVLHSRMVVGDQVLMASEVPPGRYDKPKGFGFAVHSKGALRI